MPTFEDAAGTEKVKRWRHTNAITNYYIHQMLPPLTSCHSIKNVIIIPAQRLFVQDDLD